MQKEPNQFFVMKYHVQVMGVTSDNNSLKMSLFYRVLNIATEEKGITIYLKACNCYLNYGLDCYFSK